MLKTKLNTKQLRSSQITDQSITSTQNRFGSTLICSSCSYFPLRSELAILPLSESVRQTKWLCPHCMTANECFTDQFYRYYCTDAGTVYVDTTTKNCCSRSLGAGNNQDVMLYLEVGSCMEQILSGINIGNSKAMTDKPRTSSPIKKAMMEQSKLLRIYLEHMAAQSRRVRGRYFSWDSFIRNSNVSKIEYALWLIDNIANRISSSQVHFFVFDDEKDSSCYQKRTINPQIIKEMAFVYPSLQSVKLWSQIHQKLRHRESIIVSASPLSQIHNDCSLLGAKVLLINLQELKDSVTLLPTSSQLYIRRMVDIEDQSFKFPMQIIKQQRSCSLSRKMNTNSDENCNENKSSKLNAASDKMTINKNDNIEIFDWRSYARTGNKNLHYMANVKMHLASIVEIVQQKTRELAIFIKKPTIPSLSSSWAKLIHHKFMVTKTQTSNKRKQKLDPFKIHNSEKLKMQNIVTEFTALMEKVSHLQNYQILEFINKVIMILCCDKPLSKSTSSDISPKIKLYMKFYSIEDNLVSVLYSNQHASTKGGKTYDGVVNEQQQEQRQIQFWIKQKCDLSLNSDKQDYWLNDGDDFDFDKL